MNVLSPVAVLPQIKMPHFAPSRIHFSRIVFATDFSRASEEALKTAIALSQLFGSKLFLVHAAEVPTFDFSEASPMLAAVSSANLQAAHRQMQALILSYPQLRKRQPEAVVACAKPVDLIQEVVHDEGIDLIIVGSHGASGMERMAFGSVAESILRNSSCPVLIVGPHSKTEVDPFCSIVFATDLADTDLRAARYASSLADGAHGKLTLLHVVEESSSWPLLPDNPVCKRSEKELLEEFFPAEATRHCRTSARIECGSPAEVIRDIAKEEGAGLVVVGLKDRFALADRNPWSTLSHLIRDLHCPVLAVRDHLL